jgi:hypothetical protein
MRKLVVLFFILFTFSEVFSQHLPLQIGNQWHYVVSLAPVYNHVAVATDTITLNNKKYFKIENWSPNGSQLIDTSYDRLDTDSNYYRMYQIGEEVFLFNFSWPNGFIYSTQSNDTNCVDLWRVSRQFGQIWGVGTDLYYTNFGSWCTGMSDTSWSLSVYYFANSFGSINAYDGYLKGAKINGITYGTLHPLPVELLSFSSSVVNNDVTLNWTTATETNNSGFQVERRKTLEARSEEWENIGFVNGNGTTTEPQTYSFVDENLSTGKYQYRLKQIDFDGTYEYSNIIETEILTPVKFSLEQNYPNPFNPSTDIQYAIASKQFVSLKVFNSLGEEIATLVNEEKPAGNHTIEFKPESSIKNLVSGVYLYQLIVGNFIQTKKMILLK